MSRERAQKWLCEQMGLAFPYFSMGKVDSLDLFGQNELMIFAFYRHNAKRYKKALDIGANLGLHSILMRRYGWDVQAFEPDEQIHGLCQENLKRGYLPGPWAQVTLTRAAVSDHDGDVQFVRVLQNLTGSHIAGFKDSYGPRETVTVPCVDCRPLFDWADLAKLDVEGHEGVLLKCVTDSNLKHLDLICELRGQSEAAQVLRHFGELETPIYTQKNAWKPAKSMADMPTKHQEGSIFISRRGGPFQ